MNKIIFLHTSTHLGGAEYSLLEILKNLSNKNIDLHLIFSAPYSFRALEDLSFVHSHSLQLPYPHKKYAFNEWVSFGVKIVMSSWKLYRLVKRERIAILYCNTFRSLLYCLFVKLFTSIRIICHCRDNVHQNVSERVLYKLADDFIAISNFVRSQLPEKKPKYLVYNGTQPSIYSNTIRFASLKQIYHLPNSILCIGNIGQLVPWKNQLDYLRVAQVLLKKHSNLHFFVIGEIVDKSYYLFLHRMVRVWGIDNYVTFTGFVYPISDYINDCFLIIHTAIEEPFGRVLIEAAALKKTVVAYASGGPSEIIEDGRTGYLISEHDVEAMAERVNHLIIFPQERKLMGLAAQDRIVKLFNSEINILTICKILTL